MLPLLSRVHQKAADTLLLAHLYATDRRAFRVIRYVRAHALTYLDVAALVDLYHAVAQAEAESRAGVLVEAGVALGGSSIIMAAAKRPARPFYMYDAFEMIPAPSERDGSDAHRRYAEIASGQARGIQGDGYYGYQDNLYEQVRTTLQDAGYPTGEHHIQMIRGFYEETLHVDRPVALAHLDCDWYDSVMVCLHRIVPHLVKGGVLVVDDYQHWSGCRRAVDEYFAGRKDAYRFVTTSRLHIIRQ